MNREGVLEKAPQKKSLGIVISAKSKEKYLDARMT